jgi:hypothetical protein
MSTPSTGIVANDFKHAFANLDPSRKNWVMFRRRFTIVVKAKKVWGHFDGSSLKPVVPPATTAGVAPAVAAPAVTADAMREWDEAEDLAMYLLTQKLEDTTLRKHIAKTTVVDLWNAIVAEFTLKSQMVQANMCQELMNMRARSGVDLHAEFDRL